MSTSPSIPPSPAPGKDPPPVDSFPSSAQTPPTDLPRRVSPTPQISHTPPTRENSLLYAPPPTTVPLRPSPLRKDTSDPLHPSLPSQSLPQPPASPTSQTLAQPSQELESQIPSQIQRPPFAPFFTLIHDPATSSTYHPSNIHYLFSDDDCELLTSACIRSLETPSPSPSVHESESQTSSQNIRTSSTSSSSSATFRKPPKKVKEEKGKQKEGKREERVLIVDINESGDSVQKVSSLSPNWQVLSASIDNAPTWDGAASTNSEEEDGSRGLMLRIEGMGIPSSIGEGSEGLGITGVGDKGKEKEGDGIGEEGMDKLMEVFDQKMVLLRKIVGTGNPEWGSTIARPGTAGKGEEDEGKEG